MGPVGLVLAAVLALPSVDELPTPTRLMYAAKPVYCGNLRGLTSAEVRSELERTQRVVGRTVGSVPRLFRPPYEEARAADDRVARSLGLLDVRWSIDAEDSPPAARPKEILRRLKPSLKPGAIVLLHDLHPWTP